MKKEQENGIVPIIIIVWGYSIHAERNIKIFTEDPRFRVAVISNYRYEIPGTELFLLPSGSREPSDGKTLVSRIVRKIDRPDKGLVLRAITFLLTQGPAIIREFFDSVHDIRDIKRIIARFRPQIVLLQTLLYPVYLVFFIRIQVPLMITFWNGDVIWWAKYTLFENMFKKQIVHRGIMRAKAITVNSSSAFDACCSSGKDSADIHLIRYPGADLTLFSPGDPVTARKKLHITAEHVVLWPRGAGYYHNIETLLRAVPGLVRRYSTILFILLQVIDNDNILNKNVAEWIALHPRYQRNFLFVRRDNPYHIIPEYYRASDMMVSLSSFDSLPVSMLEAMACKLPLIMGDIPQIREWIVDGENGFLVPVDSDSLLSERIVQICEGKSGANERLVLNNRALVEREFDSRINDEKLKDLAVKVAGGD
jgi:glycosyltransferase involved in cell wall biosynthesis